MKQPEVLKIFQDAGALLEGHVLLSSGLHSGQYLQCARILENPQATERLCRALAEKFKDETVSAVVGPAMGGIILAYELARAKGGRALFAEREGGAMCLRRGFILSAQDKVLVAEDVITTGGSVKEVIKLVKAAGAHLVGVAALADRSQGQLGLGVRCESLLELAIAVYPPPECPFCQQKLPLVKPGSRKPTNR